MLQERYENYTITRTHYKTKWEKIKIENKI